MDHYNADYRAYHLIYTHHNSHSLYLGDLNAATNLNFIHSQNIMTVITAALGMDQLDYSQMSVKHIIYPLLDSKRDNVWQFFQNFYEIIEKQIKMGSILVHCSAGISRSPTLVIAYLMKKENWSFKETMEFIHAKGRKVLPSLGFERQLKTYQTILKRNCLSILDKRPVQSPNQPRKKYSHNRFQQSHLPNLASARSSSFTLTLTNSNSSAGLFATMTPRRGTTPHIRRAKMSSSSERREELLSTIKTKRSSMFDCPAQEINNFQVKKVQINERGIRPKRIRSKIVLLS